MTFNPADYFRGFQAPPSLFFKGTYDIRHTRYLVRHGACSPSEEYLLRARFDGLGSFGDHIFSIKKELSDLLGSNSDLVPFLVLSPIVGIQFRDLGSDAPSVRSPQYEHPRALSEPIHPSQLPTSMKGLQVYDVDRVDYDPTDNVILSRPLNQTEYLINRSCMYSGELSLRSSFVLSLPGKMIEQYENMLTKAIQPSDKLLGMGIIFLNHKDFLLEDFLQLPEETH